MKTFPARFFLPIAAFIALGAASAFGQAAATPAKPKATLSSTDKTFLKNVAEAQLGIINLSKLVSGKEPQGAPDLQTFGKKLGTDMNTAWGELGTVATARGAEMPKTDLSSSEKNAMEKLKKEKPDKFDKEFLKALTKETKKAAQALETGEKSVQDAELKTFAQKWAPQLKTANETAEKMEAEAGKKK